jgi:tetratricopeptide (TPR) repeat protein
MNVNDVIAPQPEVITPKPPVPVPPKIKNHWGRALWFTIAGFIVVACLIGAILWVASWFSRPIYIYLLVISLTGGFGGLVYSLIEHKGLILTHFRYIEEDLSANKEDQDNKVTPAAEDKNTGNSAAAKTTKTDEKIEINPGLDLGSVGDMLIGIGSAFAVFFAVSGLVTIKNDLQSIELSSIFVLSGMGVVAGAAGKAIIPALITKMTELTKAKDTAQKAEKKANDAQQNAEKIKTEAADAHADSWKQLESAFYSAGLASLDAYTASPINKEILVTAENAFNKALEINKQSAQAKTGLGMVRKRQNKLQEAIDLCTDAIRFSPDYPDAYYNRACYQALLKSGTIEPIIADLKKAIEIENLFRDYAKTDPDFDAVKDNVQFKKLLGIA